MSADALLYEMLPRSVADLLRANMETKAEHFDDVTLFFSNIAGFTDMYATFPPMSMVSFLNQVY